MNTVNVKLTYAKLKKLKAAVKSKTGATLRMSSIVRAGYGNKKGKWIVRAGSGNELNA